MAKDRPKGARKLGEYLFEFMWFRRWSFIESRKRSILIARKGSLSLKGFGYFEGGRRLYARTHKILLYRQGFMLRLKYTEDNGETVDVPLVYTRNWTEELELWLKKTSALIVVPPRDESGPTAEESRPGD